MPQEQRLETVKRIEEAMAGGQALTNRRNQRMHSEILKPDAVTVQAPLQGRDPAPSTQMQASGIPQDDEDLAWLIDKESDGRTTAKNPHSSAFGLGQLIKANREHYGRQLGYDPNTTDYGEQLQMMLAYIKDRYGSTKAARQFWEQHGWY